MHKYLIVTLALTTLLLTSCATVDIRPDSVKSKLQTKKGRELLTKMQEAHNVAVWNNIETYSVDFTDEFYGFIGKNGNPFPGNKADMRLDYIPGTFVGKGTFLSGKWENKVWGVQGWKTYHHENGKAIFDSKNDKDVIFWIPTYQYFIEAAARITEADVISYAGQKVIGGVNCDLVYATWKSAKPQKEIDQYILALDSKTHKIHNLHYTVRDAFKFFDGNATMVEYEVIDGLLIPTVMEVRIGTPSDKDLMHTMQVSNFRANQILKSELMPDSSLGLDGK